MNRQIKVLNAIMQNWSVVQDSIRDANEAAGTAIEGNELYMDSIEGRITALKSAFQELSANLISSDLVKGITSFGTNALSIINELIDGLGGLKEPFTAILGIFAALKALKIFDALSESPNVLEGLVGSIGGFTSRIGIAVAAITAFVSAVNAINVTPAEKLESSLEAYKSAQSDVASVESELQKVKDRMEEISNIDKLSFTDQQELSNLEQQATLLEREVEAKKQLVALQQKQAQNDFIAYMQSYNSDSTNGNGSMAYDFANTARDDFWGKVQQTLGKMGLWVGENFGIGVGETGYNTFYDNLTRMSFQAGRVRALEQWKLQGATNGKYNMPMGDGTTLTYDDSYILEERNKLNNYVSMVNTELSNLLNFASPIEYNEQTAPFIDQVYRMITDSQKAQLQAGILSGKEVFDSTINLPVFEKAKVALMELGEQGEISKEKLSESIDVDLDITRFLSKCQELGLTSTETVSYINDQFANVQTPTIVEDSGITTSNALDKLFTASEGYKKLQEAMDEQSKSGILSAKTMKELMDVLPEASKMILQTADGYALSVDAVNDYVDSLAKSDPVMQTAVERMAELQEMIKAQEEYYANGITDIMEYEANIFPLQSEYNFWASIVAEINNATGALARYNAAKNTANPDAAYNTISSGVEQYKEDRKKGKTNTDDFQALTALALGEDWETRFNGDKKAAYAQAEKNLNRYFGQKDERSGYTNFFKDLASGENPIGRLENGQFILDEQTTFADMAEKLGISVDAVSALIGLASEYNGIDLSNVFDENGESVAEKVKKANELKDSYKELNAQKENLEKEGKGEGNQEYDDVVSQMQKAQEEAKELGIDLSKSLESGEAPTSIIDSVREAIEMLKEIENEPLTVTVELQTPDGKPLNDLFGGSDSNNGDGENYAVEPEFDIAYLDEQLAAWAAAANPEINATVNFNPADGSEDIESEQTQGTFTFSQALDNYQDTIDRAKQYGIDTSGLTSAYNAYNGIGGDLDQQQQDYINSWVDANRQIQEQINKNPFEASVEAAPDTGKNVVEGTVKQAEKEAKKRTRQRK